MILRDLENFSATDSEDESELEADDSLSEGEDSEAYDDDEHAEELGDSYISKGSVDNVEGMADSVMESVPENQAEASGIDDQEDQLEDGRKSKEDIQLRILDSLAKSGDVTANMLDEQLDESDIEKQPSVCHRAGKTLCTDQEKCDATGDPTGASMKIVAR